jgi:hypothetical protein
VKHAVQRISARTRDEQGEQAGHDADVLEEMDLGIDLVSAEQGPQRVPDGRHYNCVDTKDDGEGTGQQASRRGSFTASTLKRLRMGRAP